MITAWFEDTFPQGYGAAIMWTAAALLLLVAALILVRILRAFRSGTFVAGGRNRKPRLAVMDATPIDAKRRLVLVRRDDVEHLILIGGGNDLVVEQGITLAERVSRNPSQVDMDFAEPIATPLQAARPAAPPSYAPPPRPDPYKAQRPVTQIRDLTPPPPTPTRRAEIPAAPPAAPPTVQPPPARPRPETVSPPPTQQGSPRPSVDAPPRPAYVPPQRPTPEIAVPPRAPSSVTMPSAAAPRPTEASRPSGVSGSTIAPVRRNPPGPANQTTAKPAPVSNLDPGLLTDLETKLDNEKPDTAAADLSLDDEMAKLLGELSGEKR